MPRIAYCLKRRKLPSYNNLVLIFTLYSADVWSVKPVEASNSILAVYKLPPI